MDTSRELAAGLQGILKLCLAATTDCPPQPPTWLPVTLRIATIEYNGLHWQIELYRRPNVLEYTATLITGTIAQFNHPPNTAILGYDGRMIAGALYESWGIYVEFQSTETRH